MCLVGHNKPLILLVADKLNGKTIFGGGVICFKRELSLAVGNNSRNGTLTLIYRYRSVCNGTLLLVDDLTRNRTLYPLRRERKRSTAKCKNEYYRGNYILCHKFKFWAKIANFNIRVFHKFTLSQKFSISL